MKQATRRRASTRLNGHDYTEAGAYFVTVCTHDQQCILGDVVSDAVRLTPLGKVVAETWPAACAHNPSVDLDVFVVMPNHVHGILVLRESVWAKHASPLRHRPKGTFRGSLSSIVQGFKSAATRQARRDGIAFGGRLWQRGFYDHVIRNEAELSRIRTYIDENPLRWALDEENPDRDSR